MKIIEIKESPKLSKRYRVILDNNSFYDFGLDDGECYLDHGDKKKRDNYLKRHMANKTEFNLITNLVPSPSLFSAYLLWNTPNLDENIKILNELFKNKYK
jgi:hypothetical protein